MPEDLCIGLGFVGKHSAEELQRQAANEGACKGRVALAAYVSAKKALQSLERDQRLAAINAELRDLWNRMLDVNPATEVTERDDLLPALVLLNQKKNGGYQAEVLTCGHFQKVPGAETHPRRRIGRFA